MIEIVEDDEKRSENSLLFYYFCEAAQLDLISHVYVCLCLCPYRVSGGGVWCAVLTCCPQLLLSRP